MFFQKEKIAFYIESGWDEEAKELIQQNLDIVEICQAEVEKAVTRKDYTAAKQLIADGITLAEEKNHPGTVNKWKEALLRIAVAENDTETIRSLCCYFMFDSGFSTDYYRQWKQTFPATEQKDAIECVIAEKIDEKKQWSLGSLYVEEQMWDRLLEMLQVDNNLYFLEEYHDHLVKRYPKELLALYIPQFTILGNRVGNRSQYAELAGKMKRVLKDIPEAKEPITALINELISRKPRRPALIDELNRVLNI
jgi:hypothetical protein